MASRSTTVVEGRGRARPIIDLSENAGALFPTPGQKEKRLGANREMMNGDEGSEIHLVTPFDIRAAMWAEHADGLWRARKKRRAG